MKVIFSQHALDQLKVRSRITKQMVLETIKQPDKAISSYRDRRLFQKTYGSEILEIVVSEEDNEITIITEYFLS